MAKQVWSENFAILENAKGEMIRIPSSDFKVEPEEEHRRLKQFNENLLGRCRRLEQQIDAEHVLRHSLLEKIESLEDELKVFKTVKMGFRGGNK